MGLFDSLTNSDAFKNVLGQIETGAMPAILGQVFGQGGQGGLSTIVAKLEQAGFGDQIKSWIGNGQNMPISADQLQQVLGNEQVKELAAKFNIPLDQVSSMLAHALPQAVDHASPNGQLPPSA
jgi:uncharacterized protein YidB (DUF937 family)